MGVHEQWLFGRDGVDPVRVKTVEGTQQSSREAWMTRAPGECVMHGVAYQRDA